MQTPAQWHPFLDLCGHMSCLLAACPAQFTVHRLKPASLLRLGCCWLLLQTGTGWVLRELGKGHEAALLRFVDANLAQFSREGLRYALEHQPASVRQRLMAEHKERQAQGQEQEEQGGLQEEPQPEEEEVQEPGQVAPEKRRQRRQPKGGDEEAADGQRSAGTTKRRKRRE